MHNVLSNKHMAGCNGGQQEAFGVQNQHRHCVKTLKTYTKYAHIVRGKPTLKDVEHFRNGSVREPYERSLYKRTFMNKLFIKKHAISTEH